MSHPIIKEALTDISDTVILLTLITELSHQLPAKTDESTIDQETTLPFTSIPSLYSTFKNEAITLTLSDKDSQNIFLQSNVTYFYSRRNCD